MADTVRADRIARTCCEADKIREGRVAWTCCEADKVRENRVARTYTLTQMGRWEMHRPYRNLVGILKVTDNL